MQIMSWIKRIVQFARTRRAVPGKEVVMAKIIEFHVPATFQPKSRWTPEELRGKVLDFHAITKKSA